jgi:broad specificity phosphatase PhoE
MDKLTVHFIRHASSRHTLPPELIPGHSLDAELISQGPGEAISKGCELARRGVVPDRVVSSPALRCTRTGEFILDAMGITTLPMEQESRLLGMDQGPNVGRSQAEVYTDEVKQQILAEGKDFALPGAESMNQVGWRGFRWLRSEEVYVGRLSTILALAHGTLIACMVSTIEDWDRPTTLAMLRSMPPVGETQLAFDGYNWRVDSFARPVQLPNNG